MSWLNPSRWLLVGALGGALSLGYVAWERHVETRGADRVQALWSAEKLEQSQLNAKETQRRFDRQKESQDVQVKELAAARDAAARNRVDAERLRDQNDGIAKRWRDALSDPAACGQCAAAGDAIGVFADVLGRADRRAGILASYADAARAAGLQCQRDYDALTPTR